MPIDYSRGHFADDDAVLAGQVASLRMKSAALDTLASRLNVALRKAQRDATKPRQAIVRLPSGTICEVSEATREAAEAEIERLLSLFPGSQVVRERPHRRGYRA